MYIAVHFKIRLRFTKLEYRSMCDLNQELFITHSSTEEA